MALLVGGALLALGTVHLGSLLVVAAFASVAALRGAFSRSTTGIALPYAVLVGLALVCCLQAVPLPFAVLERVSPSAAPIWRHTLELLGDASSFASLSLDPGASLVEALKWLTYANAFAVAASLARHRGAIPAAGIVFGSAIVAALLTLGHGLVGANAVYGLYQPRFDVPPWQTGPLLNPNNLAGYLNLGTFCGLGLLLKNEKERRLPRSLLALGIAATIGVSITTASRGGLLTLVAGLLVFGLLLRKLRSTERRGQRLVLLSALAGGAALALLGATSDAVQQLVSRDLSKLQMARWMVPLIADFPWTGIGRGAFESVFPAYRPPGGNIVFTHAENFVVQWITEWGAPVALLALAAFAWAFFPRERLRKQSPLVVAMNVGLGALFVQNLGDLALEIPAVGIAVATLLGTIWGRSKKRGPELALASSSWFGRRSLVLVAPLLPWVLAGVLLASGYRDIASDRERVHQLVQQEPSDSDAAREAVLASMRRHPADPYFPLVAALIERRSGGNPWPWLNRSLERALVNPRAHLFAAELFHGLGRTGQALLSLRMTAEQEPTLSGHVATIALYISRDFDELASVAPQGKEGALLLEDMARRLDDREGDELRLRLYREALSRDASRPGPHEALGEARLREVERGVCDDRDACLRDVEAHAKALDRLAPRASAGTRLRARSLAAQGKADEGERMLEELCPRFTDDLPCWRTRVLLASAVNEGGRLSKAIDALLVRACVNTKDCAHAAHFAGSLLAARGEHGLALGHYLRAAREEPTEARWQQVAEAAQRVGAYAQEIDALERIARLRGGADEALRTRIDEAKLRALAE